MLHINLKVEFQIYVPNLFTKNHIKFSEFTISRILFTIGCHRKFHQEKTYLFRKSGTYSSYWRVIGSHEYEGVLSLRNIIPGVFFKKDVNICTLGQIVAARPPQS